MQSLKILHLEDDPLDAELMLATLTDAGIVCDVTCVDTETAFRAAVRDGSYNIIVSDFSMPGFDGKTALQIALHEKPETPFIFVSGTIGEEAAIESMLGGATDYVLKHRFSRLVPAILRAQRETEQKEKRKTIEAQLLRTQRMESIGTLAGGIAHDLNNVLAPILMAVELLKEIHKDETSQQLLDTLQNSARRGANIVRQVLTFARGTAGERIPLQPQHQLASMEKMLKGILPKSIRIQSEISLDLWMVDGDATQLDQVLLNLCVNARDAMLKGGELRIAASNIILDELHGLPNAEAKPGRYVVIEVSDTGHGIAPEVIDNIFEPFFTTKAIGMGSGMGLSTVLAIVRSHEGFVEVSTEVGKGTAFKVFLPAKKPTRTGEAIVQSTDFPRGNGELILVVDDESAVREIAVATLEFYGYRVVTAVNGAEATECYARHSGRIKAVLLDMMMPVMDGATTVHSLRVIDPQVKIIASSGFMEDPRNVVGSEEDRSLVRAILAKPYTAEKLLRTLSQVLLLEKT